METFGNTARYIRSKNAGPFWVTVDLFFNDKESFDKVANSANLSEQVFAEIYRIPPEQVRIFKLESILVIKVSFPRQQPQGGPYECDMHAGQQYVMLTNVKL